MYVRLGFLDEFCKLLSLCISLGPNFHKPILDLMKFSDFALEIIVFIPGFTLSEWLFGLELLGPDFLLESYRY